MRMAHCPKCGGGNVNSFKDEGNLWHATCYNKECRFTTKVGMPTRKLSRYNWNLLYESMTGETLPDEACGRQSSAFMKKEASAGASELVRCFASDDLARWEKVHSYGSFDWLTKKGKNRRKGEKAKLWKAEG